MTPQLPEMAPPTWTPDTVYAALFSMINAMSEEIDRRFDAQDKATRVALESAEKAVLKAESLATTRANQQNEWRDTVNDLINKNISRAEFAAQHASLIDKIDTVGSRVDLLEGAEKGSGSIKSQTYMMVMGAASVIMMILAVVALIVTLTH